MEQSNYERLIAGAQSGDVTAIDLLLDDCRQILKKLANAQLTEQFGADWDPSDVIQESLLEAHQGLPEFHGQRPETLLAWLRTILEHNVADRLKYQRRQKRYSGAQRSLEGSTEQWQSLRNSLLADQSSVTERIVRRERLQQLAIAINKLPEQQANVFRKRHIEGLSLNEIVEQTDRSHASIAGLLIRATRRLDTFLKDE